ncbi:MAG: hypothetical protein IJA19_02355 [Clostridia bacterium]|nr:hypothetical protein [Clostridia bacterium]
MKKPVVFWVIIAILLVINLVPSGTVPNNTAYYKDLEYLGMYNVNSVLMGAPDSLQMPLNTNHLLLNAAQFTAVKGVFTPLVISLFYLVVLGLSFYALIKASGKYKKVVTLSAVLFLVTKTYWSHLFTVLPFGGVYTFFLSAVMLFAGMFIKKDATVKGIITVTLVTLALGFYDTATALVGCIFSLVIVVLYTVSKGRKEKIISLVCGLLALVLCLSFFIGYKGVNYQDNMASSVTYGTSMYDRNFKPQDKFDVMGFYMSNFSYKKDFSQMLMNNAFYVGETAPFSVWAFAKSRVMPVNIWMFAGLMVLMIVISAVFLKKKKQQGGILYLVIALAVITGITLNLSGYLVGISNLDVNLRLFNLVLDTIFAVLVPAITYEVTERQNNLKEKYGVEQ